MENISVDISKIFAFIPKPIFDGLQNLVKEKMQYLRTKPVKAMTSLDG